MKLKFALSVSLLAIASNASAIELLCDECISSGDLKANSVTSDKIKNRTIKAVDINKGQVVKSVNGLKDNVAVVGGKNVTVTTDGNQLVIDAAVLVTGGSGGGQYDEAIADLQKTLARLKNTVTDLEALHGVNGAFVGALTSGMYEENVYSNSSCELTGGALLDGRAEWLFTCKLTNGYNLDISVISGDITGHPYETQLKTAGIDQLNGWESNIWGLVLSTNLNWFRCINSNDENGIVSVRQVGDTLSFKFYDQDNILECGFSSKLIPPAETAE